MFCQLLSILSIEFAPLNLPSPVPFNQKLQGRGINISTRAASEFCDNFSLHLATYRYIRKSFIDRLKSAACVETEWLIDRATLGEGNG